jgi:hypothetical protein
MNGPFKDVHPKKGRKRCPRCKLGIMAAYPLPPYKPTFWECQICCFTEDYVEGSAEPVEKCKYCNSDLNDLSHKQAVDAVYICTKCKARYYKGKWYTLKEWEAWINEGGDA